MKHALVPARLRRAVRGWFDSRYISLADHRQDIRDALWEVQTLSREVTALRAEIDRLRAQVAKAGVEEARARRWDDAHRLAQETAVAMDRVLQNEVLLWQAVDRLPGGPPAAGAAGVAAPPGADRSSGGALDRLAGTGADRSSGSRADGSSGSGA
ncbi:MULTISPECIES: hypothetical protein [Streptosporangium]|uniref:Uncharacterized small protein (DUF1192 family) n=1 Tax=Streptosporangium brasiliense TaxID=47480 RepID=A0ABT9RAI9_9ACTN|nr:hypothetical protein [Streptosporangium brasiliense]MDP9865420.1 uncharacterized small protein (DUF1192 family) [Streptosporangium brasiliense]